MNEADANIDLVVNGEITALKAALDTGEDIHDEIIDTGEKAYLKKHYTQMSVVNRNILNMFLHSGISS